MHLQMPAVSWRLGEVSGTHHTAATPAHLSRSPSLSVLCCCRYSEIYSERATKDFTEAERYYERAALIIPTSGNAQNQLAVLATYSQIEYVAVYHYCRSILVQQPFTGGLENLSLLFAKNARSFQSLMTTTDPAPSRSKRAGDGLPAMTNHPKSFFTSFLRLHGLLFEWSSRMHRDAASLPSSIESAMMAGEKGVAPTTEAGGAVDVDEYLSLLQSTLDSLDRLLQSPSAGPKTASGAVPPTGVLGEAVLVQLLSICLFSLHYGAMKEENMVMETMAYADGDSDAADPFGFLAGGTGQADHVRGRTVSESLALVTLFGVVNRVAARTASLLSAGGGGSKSEGGRSIYVNKLYPVMAVFCDWASVHPEHLTSSGNSQHTSKKNWYDADKNLLLCVAPSSVAFIT